MSLKTLADEYFSSLNPTASRLYTDLQETKSSYEELWTTLSEKEQQTILSESIIKPEISIKYFTAVPETENRKYGVKVIFDDHCSYRDEHSGPFTFRTQSQRDLSLFPSEKPKPNIENKARAHKPKVKPPPPPIPVVDKVIKPKISEDSRNNAASSFNTNSLPKTGLDFLDNW